MSCSGNNDDISIGEENELDGDPILVVDKSIHATKAMFSGTSVSSDDSFTYVTLDLDDSNEQVTYVEIENYNEAYTYQLKLTGHYNNKSYTVSTTSAPEVSVKSSSIESTETVSNPKLHFDLSSLNMDSDFYSAVLLEVNSSHELTLENITTTDTRTIRFIDQGGSDFYTTIRASQTNGAISGNGHPSNYSILVAPTALTNAKAYKVNGNIYKLAFYSVSDQVLVTATSTVMSSSTASTNFIDTYFTRLEFISPARIGVASGSYLVRLEEHNSLGSILRTSPFQNFKIAN